MTTFPKIVTDRLTLRQIQPSDLSSLLKHVNNKKISDEIINIPYPYTEQDAMDRMNFVQEGFRHGLRYVFAITLTDENEVMGEIGIHLDKPHDRAEVGYWVGEAHWGKGIATEAMNAILKFGFEELKLNKIIATHYVENPASGKVLIKCGMIKEAELKEHYKTDKGYQTVNQYRLTRDEFKAL